ncbi:MAG TPA: dienelactone hydrolase family protein [Steroidobacteraceae bacterium]|nr:dienelactone hydrolase family protein [Steroidobacteraceae bacterium]
MGEFTTLMARDGHEFQAYLAAPQGKPRGAVVVLQEIFGVNSHIRAVADGYAAAGYTAIAPALFDRIRRGIELGYGPEDRQQAIGCMQQLKIDDTLKDIGAACTVVKHSGRVGVIGYCWGGLLAYLAACELPVACSVVYYGKVASHLDKRPKHPVMYHFGTADKSIPVSDTDKIKAAHPTGLLYLYEGADHGFNCDQRPTYNPAAAALARQRTLEFLARYVAGDAPKND